MADFNDKHFVGHTDKYDIPFIRSLYPLIRCDKIILHDEITLLTKGMKILQKFLFYPHHSCLATAPAWMSRHAIYTYCVCVRVVLTVTSHIRERGLNLNKMYQGWFKVSVNFILFLIVGKTELCLLEV